MKQWSFAINRIMTGTTLKHYASEPLLTTNHSQFTKPPEPTPPIAKPTQLPPQPPKGKNMVLPNLNSLLEEQGVVLEKNDTVYPSSIMHSLHSFFFPNRASQERGKLAKVINKLTQTPCDIQNCVIIGIHGWFPLRIFQQVVGAPTGTSSKLCEKMLLAITDFFKSKDISLDPNNITSISLQGEGKVEERVEKLYNQLVNGESTVTDDSNAVDPIRKDAWGKQILPQASHKQKIQQAHLIMIPSHSQGVPVSVFLVERLINDGIIDLSRTRVCIMGLAGISHGPFPMHKTSVIVKYFEADAARELFAFNDGDSRISRKYMNSLRSVLSKGIKFTAIGSWYDQVVPLYSASLFGIQHPNIYRAVYIDAADYIPDFLSHLVVFALKLRNLGYDDHGLIVHLSDAIAGNVYGFGTQGHSTLYEEINCSMLGVAWAMNEKPLWKQEPQKETTTTQEPESDTLYTTFTKWFFKPVQHIPTQIIEKITPKQPTLLSMKKDSKTSFCEPLPPPDPIVIEPKSKSWGSYIPLPFKKESPPPPPPTSASGEMPLFTAEELSTPEKQSQPLNDRSIPFHAPVRLNPYFLPWVMSELLNDASLNAELKEELKELVRLYKEWEPVSKEFRNLKYRLEPLRSRL